MYIMQGISETHRVSMTSGSSRPLSHHWVSLEQFHQRKTSKSQLPASVTHHLCVLTHLSNYLSNFLLASISIYLPSIYLFCFLLVSIYLSIFVSISVYVSMSLPCLSAALFYRSKRRNSVSLPTQFQTDSNWRCKTEATACKNGGWNCKNY